MTPHWLALRSDESRKNNFILRAKILTLIRDFFIKEGFLEVETPSLVRLPGMEPHLDPVGVTLRTARGRRDGYLITSPEYAMKKILAAGFPKIFQICKSFRGGEEMDSLHNLEFTILEWYRANADYRDIMSDVENLFIYILRDLRVAERAKQENKKTRKQKNKFENFPPKADAPLAKKIKYRGKVIDLSKPWPRLTVKDAFGEYAGIDLDKAFGRPSMAGIARKKGYVIKKNDGFDDIFFKIFLSEIEPNLGRGRPTILYDWPAEMAALSRKKKDNLRYAERFEVYIGGLELGNAFSELVDSDEQRERLTEERKLRKKLGKEIYDIDEDFLRALKDMPPSGGIAMGVDRIAMLFADARSIEEIIFFPTKQVFNL